MKAPFLIGRVLFGAFFLKSGIDHLRNHKQMTMYAKSKGIPEPELAVALSAIPLLAGGASLVLGIKPKMGALAVLGFLAGVSPVMHDFWRNEDPKERDTNVIMFAKNLALAGAATALMGVDEPWQASLPVARPSLAHRISNAAQRIAA